MVKNLIISCLIMLGHIIVYSQNIKTYSGNYKDGIANYHYYENDKQERIYHGDFTYIDRCLTITGQLKNNVKNGVWTYIYLDTSYNFYAFRYYKLVGNFINGKMEGSWVYSYYLKDKKSKKIEEFRDMNFNFLNNKFIGEFSLNEQNMYHSDGISSLKINGIFSNIGYLDSLCTINYIQNGIEFETLFNYSNGVLYSSSSRDLSTGRFIEKFDSSEFINNFFTSYNYSTNVSIINNQNYSIDSFNIVFDDIEKDDLFRIRDLGNMISKESEYHSIIKSYILTSEELYGLLSFWINIHDDRFYKIDRIIDDTLVFPIRIIIEN